jgi:hypothetical protein
LRGSALAAFAAGFLAGCPACDKAAEPIPTGSPALDQLAEFGAVPHCAGREQIVPAGEDHAHVSAPVPRLRRLAGQSAKLIPFVENPDARVVRRALDLLCSAQDAAAKEAIARLVARRPCVGWLRRALGGAGIARASLPPDLARQLDDPAQKQACEKDDVPGLDSIDPRAFCKTDPFDPRLRASFASWAGPASEALSKRLAEGEDVAFAQALDALYAFERGRARTAVAAMAAIDTPEGYLKLIDFFHAWDRRSGQATDVQHGNFARGVGGAALERVAAKAGRPLGEELLAMAQGASDERTEALFDIGPWVDKGFLAAVHAARVKGGHRQALSARMERHEYLAAMGSGIGEPISAELEAAYKASDKERLRRLARSEEPRRYWRLVAAYYLALLGDGDCLDLFEQVERVQPEEVQGLRQALDELRAKTSGPVRERVEGLLTRWKRADKQPSKEDFARAANALSGGE